MSTIIHNGIKARQTSFQQYTCKAIATFVSKKQFDTFMITRLQFEKRASFKV